MATEYQMTLAKQAEQAFARTGDFYKALDALKMVGWSERPAARAVATVQRNRLVAA